MSASGFLAALFLALAAVAPAIGNDPAPWWIIGVCVFIVVGDTWNHL